MNIELDSEFIEFAYDLYFSVRLVQSKEHMDNNEDDLNSKEFIDNDDEDVNSKNIDN